MSTRFKKRLLGWGGPIAFSALIAWSGAFVPSARADNFDLGTLSVGDVNFGRTVPYSTSSFLDEYNFVLATAADDALGLGALNFSLRGTPYSHISGLSLVMFDAANGILGVGADAGNGANITLSNVPAGDYRFTVSGIPDGTNGGQYAGVLSVSPVPEPDIWMTMLAGLGIVGVIARRRRQAD